MGKQVNGKSVPSHVRSFKFPCQLTRAYEIWTLLFQVPRRIQLMNKGVYIKPVTVGECQQGIARITSRRKE
jgi:hypothetical protein